LRAVAPPLTPSLQHFGDRGAELWQTAICQAFNRLEAAVSANLEVLQSEVLQLAPADRARLFELLLASIDTDSADEQAWELEADRRELELESGLMVTVPGQQAIARLRARLAP